MAETQERPVRLCDSCGQVDTAPRHVHGVGPGDSPTSPEVAAKGIAFAKGDEALLAELLRQIQDTTTQVKHMDCCASDGCPDGSCAQIHAGSDKPLQNDALVKHLTSGKVDAVGEKLNAQRLSAAQKES